MIQSHDEVHRQLDMAALAPYLIKKVIIIKKDGKEMKSDDEVINRTVDSRAQQPR